MDPIALLQPTKLVDFNQPNIYCITVKSLLQSVVHHLSPINFPGSSALIAQHGNKHDHYGYVLFMCGSLQEFWRVKLNDNHLIKQRFLKTTGSA